ncbi:MAG: hypothetical protein V2A76_13530 [Planctomycetota bacterium]
MLPTLAANLPGGKEVEIVKVATVVRVAATIWWIALGLLTGESASAQFAIFPFDKDLTAHVQSYHQDPKPADAIDWFFELDLEEFNRGAEATRNPHSKLILTAFMAQIIHDHPELELPFAKRMVAETSGEKASLGAEILACGATKHRAEAFETVRKGFGFPEEVVAKSVAPRTFYFPEMEVTHWQVLDVLWGGFYASGDELYIRKIAGMLETFQVPDDAFKSRLRELYGSKPEPGSAEGSELVKMLSSQSAMMSLTRNAAMYPAVLDVLERVAKTSDGRVKELATSIVTEARARNEKEAATQEADNVKSKEDFSAALWLTKDSEAFYEAMKRPEPPVLRPTRLAVRGEPIETTILFWNPKVGEDGRARVTYDVLVKKPDGSVYAEVPDLVGIEGPCTQPPEADQLGSGFVTIIIEPDDPSGKYWVHATVVDHNRNVTLELKEWFVVEE